MKLTYVGPFDAVRVPLPYGGEAECERGGTVEVPDTLGESLLEQKDNWQPAPSAKKEAKADEAEKGGDV